MATARSRNSQMRCILSVIICSVATLLFITSMVLVVIGYLNPFGSIGLGILGAGAVLFFSTILVLCGSFVWVNRNYPEEPAEAIKWNDPPNEDASLLKPSPSHAMEVVVSHKDIAVCQSILAGKPSVPYTGSNVLNVDRRPGNDYSAVLGSDVFPVISSRHREDKEKLSNQALELCLVGKDLGLGKITDKSKLAANYNLEANRRHHISNPQYINPGNNHNQDQKNQLLKNRKQSADVSASAGDLTHKQRVPDNSQEHRPVVQPHSDVNAINYAQQRKSDPIVIMKTQPIAQNNRAAAVFCTSKEGNLHDKSNVHDVTIAGFKATAPLLPSKVEMSDSHRHIPQKVGTTQPATSNAQHKGKPDEQYTSHPHFDERYNKITHRQENIMPTNDSSLESNRVLMENKQTALGMHLKPLHKSPAENKQTSCPVQGSHTITLQHLAPSHHHEQSPAGAHHSTEDTKADETTEDIQINKRHAWAADMPDL